MKALLIDNELQRAIRTASREDIDFYSQACKREREWWVLGHAVVLLRLGKHDFPTHAEPTEPPQPDFLTFTDSKLPFRPMELAEALRRDRKRHDEVKQSRGCDQPAFRHVDPIDDPFSSLRAVLRSKFKKRYGAECWLLIYHNMWMFDFPRNWSREWSEHLGEEVQKWKNSALLLGNSPYEKILVLNSGGNELVSIHPQFEVIHKL